MKGTRQIDRDDLVPFLDREILDLLDVLDAGIVDQDIDAAEGLGCGFDQVGNLGGLRHVGRMIERPAFGQ